MNKSILALALLAASSATIAAKGDMWINIHFAANHEVETYWNLDSKTWEDYNNVNPGLGLEYEMSNHWSAKAGMYKNSLNSNSAYAGANLHTAYGDGVSVGLNLGLATGYEAEHDTPVVPVIMPNLNIQIDKIRFEVGVLPGIGKYITVYAFTVGVGF